jgi:activator of HSP90 ATPase
LAVLNINARQIWLPGEKSATFNKAMKFQSCDLFGFKNKTMKQISIVAVLIAATNIIQLPVIAQVKTASPMTENVKNSDSAKGITIHQEVNFKIGPQKLYETLLSSKEFSDCTKRSFDMFTGASAKIEAKQGGTFSLFDGHIIGMVIELIPNQRIVEAWRVVDWPAGVYSIARFELVPDASGTRLIFDHIGFPDGLKEHLTIGWQQHYWDALTKYFSL